MNYPPTLVYLKFCSIKDDHGNFALWIPLFILVPVAMVILLAIFLIMLPFLLISLIFTWNMWWWRWLWHSVPVIFTTLHLLPGIRVRLENNKQQMQIEIY